MSKTPATPADDAPEVDDDARTWASDG